MRVQTGERIVYRGLNVGEQMEVVGRQRRGLRSGIGHFTAMMMGMFPRLLVVDGGVRVAQKGLPRRRR